MVCPNSIKAFNTDIRYRLLKKTSKIGLLKFAYNLLSEIDTASAGEDREGKKQPILLESGSKCESLP
jgi:hypothetical protein